MISYLKKYIVFQKIICNFAPKIQNGNLNV